LYLPDVKGVRHVDGSARGSNSLAITNLSLLSFLVAHIGNVSSSLYHASAAATRSRRVQTCEPCGMTYHVENNGRYYISDYRRSLSAYASDLHPSRTPHSRDVSHLIYVASVTPRIGCTAHGRHTRDSSCTLLARPHGYERLTVV
jgi:hypothetical protein